MKQLKLQSLGQEATIEASMYAGQKTAALYVGVPAGGLTAMMRPPELRRLALWLLDASSEIDKDVEPPSGQGTLDNSPAFFRAEYREGEAKAVALIYPADEKRYLENGWELTPLYAEQPAPIPPNSAELKPLTDTELRSACLTYRHDFGLLDKETREQVEAWCRQWDDAIRVARNYSAYVAQKGGEA
jgi:hypothetical protein